MRISDWSSDVCSSDLLHLGSAQAIAVTAAARRPLDFGHQQIAEQLWNIDRIYLGVGGRKPLAAQPIPIAVGVVQPLLGWARSEEHTSELQSLMRISYAVFCLKKKTTQKNTYTINEYTT